MKKTSGTGIAECGLTRSQRSEADAQAPMGMGATNILERVGASVGLLNGVTPDFGRHLDVANAGVLLALPALLSCGLLRNVGKHFVFPSGYYRLDQHFLAIAFLALCRMLKAISYPTGSEEPLPFVCITRPASRRTGRCENSVKNSMKRKRFSPEPT